MKKFNITGTCIPHMHYMVNIDKKVEKVIPLIEEGLYFVISRPRQYGKTTLLSILYRELRQSEEYLLIKTSFEGIGNKSFENEQSFSESFLLLLTEELKREEKLRQFIQDYKPIETLKELNLFLSDFVEHSKRKVVLMIDEVDKASNFDLFISFLGMLRDKYLKRADGINTTFHSVILAGLHDIKNIKLKIRPDSDSQYNSPWNIATEFKVDLSFSAKEIETMLVDYQSHQTSVDARHAMHLRLDQENISVLSQEIYKYTSGYPFLVSKLCKLIEEELDKDWTIDGIQNSINLIMSEQNTLFDDMVKNIEAYPDLYQLIQAVLLDNAVIDFNPYNPVVNYGVIYGIFGKNNNKLVISNKIFEVFLYNYMVSKLEVSNQLKNKIHFVDHYLDSSGNLNMEYILLKFQEFIKSTYSNKNETFYETHGRLLLVAFIKPIINGTGFYYLESQHSYERRSDMIITFNKNEYILELKLWYGQQYHEEGLQQLAGYLETRNQDTGYLVAFNFNQNKEFTNKWNDVNGKKIFEVVV